MNATHTVGAVARRGRREDESFGTMFTAWVAIFFALISPCARVGSGDRASAKFGDVPIDPATDCYPFCIVWTDFKLCTWCFPFVGHMGIGDSKGQVHEFMGFGGLAMACHAWSGQEVGRVSWRCLSASGLGRCFGGGLPPWDRCLEEVCGGPGLQ